MILSVTEKEVEAVLNLPSEKRFSYFVKRLAGSEEAWGLYNEGWALAQEECKGEIFPLWPAPVYARCCAVNLWENFSPKKIPLDEMMQELFPTLAKKEIKLGIFLNPEGQGIVIETLSFLEYLGEEMDNY